jgi:hypothetical protein
MARYLLDGCNPLDFDDALKRFAKLEFGDMGLGCVKDMLAVVKEGAAFAHGPEFVEEAAVQLANTLIKEESAG